MKPEDYIPINVNEPLLKKYFEFDGILANKGIYSIERKYYDQVKDLLSEYGIQDQYYIDNFCFLEMIFWGQRKWAKEQDSKNEMKEQIDYFSDLSRFGEFLEKHQITGILFRGNNKKKEARSESFSDPKFLKETMEGLSEMINRIKRHKESGTFNAYKKRPGAEWKHSGYWLKETFNGLRIFLNDTDLSELNDLSEGEENYFAGRLFSIAGIIDPFHNEDKDRAGYKNEKDYLIKRMQKYR